MMFGRLERDETALHGLAFGFAIADRGVEAVKDFAREKIFQRAAVAGSEGADDHLVSGAGADDEMVGIEALVRRGDGVEPGRDRASLFGDAFPALGRLPPVRSGVRGCRICGWEA